jgi:hypothetical protein
VVDAFSTAGADSHDAADYVGHGGLASRVREFADGWDIRRGEFSEELRHLAAMFEAIDDTFTDLDNRAASELRDATAAVTRAAGRAVHGRGRHGSIDPVARLSTGDDR